MFLRERFLPLSKRATIGKAREKLENLEHFPPECKMKLSTVP